MRALFRNGSVLILCAGVSAAQITQRMSLGSSGAQGNAHSTGTSMSSDARFALFASYADNLVSGDTNSVTDLFIRDRTSSLTTRVSVDSAGNQGNAASSGGLLTPDGRYIGFSSAATNLVAADTNGFIDVFVRGRLSGSTVRASVSSSGAEGNEDSFLSSLSADGRYVAFFSRATSLVAGDSNVAFDAFVRDLQSGQTSLVSVNSSGVQGNRNSHTPLLSSDGRFVAFYSYSTNIVVPDATPFSGDVFLHDRTTGQTVLVSADSAGIPGNDESQLSSISADGRYVVFNSWADNLVAADANGLSDVFVRDVQLGQTSRISVDSSGGEAGGSSTSGTISPDGRWVAFNSIAPDLVAGDSNGKTDAFVHDRTTGQTVRVSVSTSGAESDDHVNVADISADGRVVAFWSWATNLVPGDTNGTGDAFVRDLGCPAAATYCTAKPNSLGCVPTIALAGSLSATAGSGAIVSTVNLLGGKNGLFLHSTSASQAAPFHGGFLCVAPPFKRHAMQSSGGTAGACNGSFAEDLNAYIASGADPALVAGASIRVQTWSRDSGDPFGDSLSNAVTADICQ